MDLILSFKDFNFSIQFILTRHLKGMVDFYATVKYGTLPLFRF